MKTQDWVETSVLLDNDICPTILASGVSLSIIMPVPSHTEFFHTTCGSTVNIAVLRMYVPLFELFLHEILNSSCQTLGHLQLFHKANCNCTNLLFTVALCSFAQETAAKGPNLDSCYSNMILPYYSRCYLY